MDYQLGKFLERIEGKLDQIMTTNAAILEAVRGLHGKVDEVRDDINKLAARIPGAEDATERQEIADELAEVGRKLDEAGAVFEDTEGELEPAPVDSGFDGGFGGGGDGDTPTPAPTDDVPSVPADDGTTNPAGGTPAQ